MNLLDIFVTLKLDKAGFTADLKEAEKEAESAGLEIEYVVDKGSKSLAQKWSSAFTGASTKLSELSTKMNAAGDKMVDFGAKASQIGQNLTTNITKPALNAASTLGKMFLGKGWERMSVLTQAKNKLSAMGYEADEVENTMSAVGDAVDGTAFSTAQFANVAAQALSMNYKKGAGLEEYLQTVSDLAAFTGKDVEQIASVTAKAASQNKLTGETFQQLSDAAVPILQWIQDEYQVTAEEARKMVSSGEISFAEYEEMVNKHIGGMAQAVGDSTLQGALSSMQAYIAKVGESFLGAEDDANSFAGQLLPLVNSFNEWLISLGDKAQEVGAVVGEAFGAVVDYIQSGNVDLSGLSENAQTVFAVIQPFIDLIMGIIDAGKKLVEVLGPETVAKIVAAVLAAGPIISLIGGISGGIGVLMKTGSKLFEGTSKLFNLIAKNPLLTIISVIAMIIIYLVNLYNTNEEFREKVDSVISSVKEAWDSFTSKIQSVVTKVQSAWTALVAGAVALGGKISSAFRTIRTTVSTIWNGIKEAMTHPIQTAVTLITGFINKIKRIVNFKISLPHIKLPHFSVSGSANPIDWIKNGVPRISVSWYKKAENNPYMFKDATIFGAGESNDEILYGRSALMQDIKAAVNDKSETPSNVFNINLYYNASDDANDMVRDVARGLNRYKLAGVF